VVAVLVVALVQAFVVKLYRVPSGSMEPTLQGTAGGGDRILVNRLAFAGGASPEPGDVVVLTRPADWGPEAAAQHDNGGLAAVVRAFGDLTGLGPTNEQYLVKRVVARAGQTIACCDVQGRLQRGGVGIDEPYVTEDVPFEPGRLDCATPLRSARCFGPFSIPEGQLVLLGDHRSASADSVAGCRIATESARAGCLRTAPVSGVVGRVEARIWPLDRISLVK
jgi:signal peptidase I